MQRLLELIYLMLPAYFANMAPPFARFWHGWNRLIHRESLGDHKTVVGFAFGVGAAVVVAFLQAQLNIEIDRLWPPQAWLVVGLALGVGAMVGDSLKSLLKRRIGIAPGGRWIPADQLDFVIGALIALSFLVTLNVADVFVILLITFVADIAVNHISHRVGIRDTAW